MKIKTDPVVSLSLPPLFTHQYAESVHQLLQSTGPLQVSAHEQGMRDAFLYINNTVQSIVKVHDSEVNDSLQALAAAQRLLLAHDHAIAVHTLRRLYTELHEVEQQISRHHDLASCERKRVR
uniref:Uncharacterized protein n=1 Tax=Lygus hesperus TaxID=30085 RepID=A0A146M1N5_LYGHE